MRARTDNGSRLKSTRPAVSVFFFSGQLPHHPIPTIYPSPRGISPLGGGVTVQTLKPASADYGVVTVLSSHRLPILTVCRSRHLAAAASTLAMTSLNHRNKQSAHAPITTRRDDSQRDNSRVTGSVYSHGHRCPSTVVPWHGLRLYIHCYATLLSLELETVKTK